MAHPCSGVPASTTPPDISICVDAKKKLSYRKRQSDFASPVTEDTLSPPFCRAVRENSVCEMSRDVVFFAGKETRSEERKKDKGSKGVVACLKIHVY